MKSKICFLFLLILLKERGWEVSSFQIPDIDFQKHIDGFKITLPDENGISKMLTVVYIDQQCPALINYITEKSNSSWSSIVPHKNPNAVSSIEMNLMVEHQKKIYLKKQTYQISDFGIESQSSAEYMPEQKCNEWESLLGNCEASETLLNGYQVPVYCTSKKVFEDEFNGPQLNTSIWSYDIRTLMYSEMEELIAFDDKETNSFIENGILHIRPTINPNPKTGSFSLGRRCSSPNKQGSECQINRSSYSLNPPVFSARIHTKNKFSFRYGRIEIKARLPIGDWLFPNLLLQPKSTNFENLYPQQLKIAAARGNRVLFNKTSEDIGGRRLFGGTIFWPSPVEPIENFAELKSEKHFGDDFHIYTVTWKRSSIKFAVDGTVYGEIKEKLNQFSEEMYLVIGLTVGGFRNFPDEDLPPGTKPYMNQHHLAALNFWKAKSAWSSTWDGKQDLEIDYIRIYSV